MKRHNILGLKSVVNGLLILCCVFLLTSCLEVKQQLNIAKDGSGDARLEVAVQEMWASQVIPKVKSDMPKGWNVIEEKVKEGKQVIVFSRKFKEVSELNDDETRYTFASERKGFMKRSYAIEVKQLKSSDMPFPYEVIIKIPGSIEETNGQKISSAEVKWSLQGLRSGTSLTVKSSALAMPGFASLKESFNKTFDSIFYREAIVFLRDDNIWIMDSGGENQKKLTNEKVDSFSVSTNGKILFLKKGEGERLSLYIMVGKRTERLVAQLKGYSTAVISPDGSKAVCSNDEGTYLIDLETKEKKKIPLTALPQNIGEKLRLQRGPRGVDQQWFLDDHFRWSQDGKRLTFYRGWEDKFAPTALVMLQEVDTINPPIVVGEQLAIKDPWPVIQYSPIGFTDGKLLFKTTRNIYSYEIATGNYMLIGDFNKQHFIKISSSGKLIAYEGEGELWVMTADGKGKKRLANYSKEKIHHIFNLGWSSDDKKIYFTTSGREHLPQTWMINSDGSNLNKIADGCAIPWEQKTSLASSMPTSMPKITFISPSLAKTIILVIMALTGILLLFGMVLITRKAVKAVIPKGKAARKSIFCTQCGKENSPDASFCTNCGQRLK